MEEKLVEFVMRLLKNKKEAIRTLGDNISRCETIVNGTNKVINSIEEGGVENVKRQLKNNMVATREISHMIHQLTLLFMIIISSDDFSSQVAELANRLGKGQEALQELLRQKMG